MESEVKIAFSSKEQLFSIVEEDWFKDYCLDTSPKMSVNLDNTYYDTEDLKLSSRGASIRVRKYETEEGDRYEHTVKFGGGVINGLHQRYEWNVDSEKKDFNLQYFIRKACESDDPIELLTNALDGITEEDIKPLCSTVFERTTYTFGFGDSMMEACFDYGKIYAGDKEEVICELEIELEAGDVVDLKEMAQFVIDNTDGEPFDKSKFRRCLDLLNIKKEA